MLHFGETVTPHFRDTPKSTPVGSVVTVSFGTVRGRVETKKPAKLLAYGCSGSILDGEMVGRDGFEPSTNWLKANCSTD